MKLKNEGQRQLLEQPGSESELAAKLGCGTAIVGHWRRGRRIPGDAHRHKLELLFGIHQRAWDLEPGTDPWQEKPTTEAVSISSDDDTLAITKAQIESILLDLEAPNMTDAARSKARDTLAKLLALRARLERERDMLEDRIVREHPAWVRTKAAILRTLKPYPEIAALVADALVEALDS